MEVVAEKNVVDEECEVQEILLDASVIDESKVQDSLIDDWSKKVLSESDLTERNKSIKEIISLIITQKVEQRKRKELNQFAVFELFICLHIWRKIF